MGFLGVECRQCAVEDEDELVGAEGHFLGVEEAGGVVLGPDNIVAIPLAGGVDEVAGEGELGEEEDGGVVFADSPGLGEEGGDVYLAVPGGVGGAVGGICEEEVYAAGGDGGEEFVTVSEVDAGGHGLREGDFLRKCDFGLDAVGGVG